VAVAASAAAAAAAIEERTMSHKAKSIGAAACALLGSAGAVSAAEPGWEIDSAVLVYSETDRVSLVEPVIAVRHTWDERTVGARVTLDTLTGPSPSGATPASTPQTFTGPSGGGDQYTAAPGEIPLDDSFKDTRFALALDYGAPLFGAWTASYGLNFSTEYDYLSLGGSLHVQRDFNQHNTTLAFGAGYAQDTIEPVGGLPEPLTVLQPRQSGGEGDGEGDDDGEDREGRGTSDTKSVADVLVGLTQVLDRHSLARVNLVFSQSSGYLNDPYKIVSVVGTDGEPLRYVRESRPDSRTKTGLFTEYLRDFSGDTFKLGYRFLTDDWGIASHTVETSYRLRVGSRSYIEPQLRYYLQSAADFYRIALFDGEEQTVQNVSADYRLGDMSAWTAGVQLGHKLPSGSDVSLRLAYYVQTPKEGAVPAQAAAGLSKFGDLVPDTQAVMATIAYRFNW
jgi:hypothetical protein